MPQYINFTLKAMCPLPLPLPSSPSSDAADASSLMRKKKRHLGDIYKLAELCLYGIRVSSMDRKDLLQGKTRKDP